MFTFLFIRLKLCDIDFRVFSDFPFDLAFIRVFIIWLLCSCCCVWGRRLVSEFECVIV